jgi:hypothetical protein
MFRNGEGNLKPSHSKSANILRPVADSYGYSNHTSCFKLGGEFLTSISWRTFSMELVD